MAPLQDGLGQTSSWVIVAVDVHETHLRQEGMEFALQSAKALTLSLDFDETVQVVWEYAPSMGDWTAMYLFEPDGELRRCCYDLQTNELGSWTVIDSAEPHKAPTAIHLQEGESMSFPGGETNATWDPCARIDADLKRLLKGVHFRTLYNVPLISHEERFGSLVVIRKTPLHADDETGRRIRLFGMRLATALGNARLYSEAKARSDAWERVSEAKSEFLGLVSHELRNPLTVIYGGLESLVSHKDAPEEERQEVLLATQKETRRLRYMVEDLLAMSRIESKGRSQLEPVLLQRQVRLILSEFSDRWRDNVFFFVDEGLPPVWGEPTFVGQVLRNLVDNADKYSPRHLPIEVTISRQDDRTVVSVADHGPGVHDDELQQIFERFYQAAESRGQSGLGLGLTVCRRLVEAQGGRIWAESRLEGGLVVSFTLDDVDLS
jgi:signal transduction histidine kinase